MQSKLYWEKYLAHASTRSVEEIGQGSREAALAFREVLSSQLAFMARLLISRSSAHTHPQEKFRKALAQMEERLPFERIVQKRTFFHVKPIEEPLLENWYYVTHYDMAEWLWFCLRQCCALPVLSRAPA